MNQDALQPRTAPPWVAKRVISTWWVSARVNGVLVPVAAFTHEQDAKAVVRMVNASVEKSPESWGQEGSNGA